MTRFPPPSPMRQASLVVTAERRLKALEERLDNSLPANTGIIDPNYNAGEPMVFVGSDASLSGPYQYLSSYTPLPSDTVLLLWLNGTWAVAGKLI